MATQCPFCNIPVDRIIDSNRYGIVIRDGFPVSPGHTLIIPRNHISSWFDLNNDEKIGLLELQTRAQLIIEEQFKPDGYNIGINDGPAAGQTIPHLHMHLIPRYRGDVVDPRGGVRWVIPDKAAYWE